MLHKKKKKEKKGGKQMAKQINYTKKNHVTCQIYTLFYVAVFLSFLLFFLRQRTFSKLNFENLIHY